MYDFIIIGSGASGGILASNLHQSGAKVLLIEAGKFYRKNTFPDNEMEFSAQLFWGGGIEFDTLAKTFFLRAKVVGGTTIVNQALADRFDDIAWNDWHSISGVDFFNTEKMSPWYDKTEARLALHTFEANERNNNAQKYVAACDKLGFGWKKLRRAQSDCATEKGNDCIGCLGGCFRDSKQSSLVTTIQPAEQKGLEIRSEFEVVRIEHASDKVTIHGIEKGSKVSLSTRHLCLAAGCFGTTKLLLNSGFKAKLPALGKRFAQHPQFMYFGVFDEIIDAHLGAFQTVASYDPNFRKAGFKLENVYAQPISVAMLFNRFGNSLQEMMRYYRKMTCIEVAVRDEAAGGELFTDKKGKLHIKKQLTDQDRSRRQAGVEALRQIFAAQGAKQIIESPFYFGLHLMGGCVIGTDSKNSVVAPDFRLHGFRNISISDSSIFPDAPGINPALTITTLSNMHSQMLVAGN